MKKFIEPFDKRNNQLTQKMGHEESKKRQTEQCIYKYFIMEVGDMIRNVS